MNKESLLDKSKIDTEVKIDTPVNVELKNNQEGTFEQGYSELYQDNKDQINLTCKEVITKEKKSMRKAPKTKIAPSKKHSCRKAKKEIKKPGRPKITTRNPKALNFKCKHCDSSFSRAVSLGGHVSKMHAGMQSGY